MNRRARSAMTFALSGFRRRSRRRGTGSTAPNIVCITPARTRLAALLCSHRRAWDGVVFEFLSSNVSGGPLAWPGTCSRRCGPCPSPSAPWLGPQAPPRRPWPGSGGPSSAGTVLALGQGPRIHSSMRSCCCVALGGPRPPCWCWGMPSAVLGMSWTGPALCLACPGQAQHRRPDPLLPSPGQTGAPSLRTHALPCPRSLQIRPRAGAGRPPQPPQRERPVAGPGA